jgi:hypothetical protein
MTIKLSDYETIEAPPFSLLVERDDVQEQYNGIIQLSYDYRKHTLGSAASVRAVGYGLGSTWNIGDRILLGPAAGKKIEFGITAEKVLWKVLPSQVLLRLYEGADATTEGAHPTRGMKPGDFSLDVDRARDQGDPEGLR